MSAQSPTVAIVGRPNVGKSTLFNRIIGKRDAIVDDQPGVTRDLKYRATDWNGKSFRLIDTGGYFGPDEDPLTPYVQERIDFAIRDSDALVFILDAKDGPVALDHAILDILRRTSRPMIAAVNKIDDPSIAQAALAPFYELGFDEILPISASHGSGIGDLLDAVVEYLPETVAEEAQPDIPGLAILGRPNVGKSTLLNALCGSERAIVSPIAGTTRDPVDTEIVVEGKRYLLIDTAGVRRRGKMSQGLDRFALMRAQAALDRCHIALLLIDGIEGLTETDAKVFHLAQDSGKAAIIVVNKWDAVEKDQATSGAFAKEIRERLPFLHFAPIEFVSALTKKRVHRIFPHIEKILEQYYFRAPTGELNRLMERITAQHPPPVHKGRSPRLYYWTQAGVAPPTFVCFVSDPKAIHFSYQRYLVNRLYDTFGFYGTPIRMFFRARSQKEKGA